jgi:hypothetical protein
MADKFLFLPRDFMGGHSSWIFRETREPETSLIPYLEKDCTGGVGAGAGGQMDVGVLFDGNGAVFAGGVD